MNYKSESDYSQILMRKRKAHFLSKEEQQRKNKWEIHKTKNK